MYIRVFLYENHSHLGPWLSLYHIFDQMSRVFLPFFSGSDHVNMGFEMSTWSGAMSICPACQHVGQRHVNMPGVSTFFFTVLTSSECGLVSRLGGN